jgi:uncharacterized membrane protein YkoI
MKNKFTLGAIAGISALALAVPLLAQISSAASSTAAQPSSAQQVPADAATTTAQISQQAAEQTALAAHPGALSEATRLDSHFGGYKVEVKGSDGNDYDVIVDATTGKVTDSWIDGQGGPRGHGPRGSDTNAQPTSQI